MRTGLFTTHTVLAMLCLCIAVVLPAWAAGEVTFTFQPPDNGITFIRTEQETTTETITSAGESETEKSVEIEKTKIEIVKTATGYQWTETMLSCSKEVNGKKVEPNALVKVSIDMPIIYHLDKTGKLVSIQGLKELREKALAELKGEQLEMFENIMTEELMDYLSTEEWNAATMPFLGVVKKPGDTWESTTKQYIFSSKLMPVISQVTLQKLETVIGRPCAVVKTTWNPDLKAAAEDLRISMEEEAQAIPKEAKAKYTVLSYTIESVKTIDPVLLLALKNTETRTRKFQVAAMGRKIVFEEKKESSSTCELGK